MRFTIGTLMVIFAGALFAGPLVAPSLYDPFSKSMVTFFGIAWGMLGIMFWRVMPSVNGIFSDKPTRQPPRASYRRGSARPPL